MATIKKGLPADNFTKISNSIIHDKTLSLGAFKTYSLYANMPNGKRVSDSYMVKVLGVSSPTFARWKKELKDRNLIWIDRLGPKEYDLYLGYDKYSPQAVKRHWDEAEK